MNSAVLRLATRGDLPSIAALEQAVFGDSWSLADLEQMWGGAATRWWVVVGADEEVWGYALYRITADEGELLRIAIAAERQRRGLGLALLGQVMTDFSSALREEQIGSGEMWLEVSAENTAAQALYKTVGFSEQYRRRDYYAAGVDGVVMMMPGSPIRRGNS